MGHWGKGLWRSAASTWLRWIVLAAGVGPGAFVHASDRTALVIGNQDYEVGRLLNPRNDAMDVAAALRALGFEVRLATDLDRAGMLEQLDAFARSIQPGGLAFFYYAGHGIELSGENWLLPVRNRVIATQAQVRIHSVSARDALQIMEERGARLNVMVLDACRDSPLPSGARSGQRGLAPLTVGTSTLVAYSTSPGSTAADGAGRNSPYTAAFLDALGRDDVVIPELFAQTGASVLKATRGAQVPWTSNTPIWPSIVLASRSTVSRPGPVAAVQEGELKIEVSPSTAIVRVDGVLLGTGSRSLREASGKTVVVRAEAEGHEPLEERVRVQGGQVADVVLRLTPLALLVAPAPEQAVAAVPDKISEAPVVRPTRPRPATIVIEGSAPAPPVGQIYRRKLAGGGESPEMVVLPDRIFLMGSPDTEPSRDDDEGPQRRVRIRSFAIGVTEVTFADWDRCLEAGGCGGHRPPGSERGNLPVTHVSWENGRAYARWLGSQTGRTFRLPSESEWEYAARAGTTSAFWWGNELGANLANCIGCGSTWDGKRTAPTGSFPANPWSLHDTSGNVWEWMDDCYRPTYDGQPEDGRALSDPACGMRVLRGGSWNSSPEELRSAGRYRYPPTARLADLGFRVVEEL